MTEDERRIKASKPVRRQPAPIRARRAPRRRAIAPVPVKRSRRKCHGHNPPEGDGDGSSPRAQERLKYLARHLHALGPKPLFHFLDEFERGAPLRAHLEAYAELPADFIKAYGGDQFAPAAFILRGC